MKIYHNPRCSKSRETLHILHSRGFEPQIIEYLETPPSANELAALIRAAGLEVRQALRNTEAVYADLGLNNPELSNEQLIHAMVQNPVLIERPFVVTDKGTRLCRPPAEVEAIL